MPTDPPSATPFASPSPFATPLGDAAPSSQTHYVLDTMGGWNLDWNQVKGVLVHYQSSLWWLLIVLLAIFILGTQLVFFPLFHRVMKLQATSAMRLAYLASLFVAVVLFHWWLWHWIFFALTKNYWIWLIWCLLSMAWLGLIVWTPKRRVEG